MNHIKVGDMGEKAAAEFLKRAGYQILAHQYRSKTGEIDIIASHYGFPAEAVTYAKQQKIIKIALCYLHHAQKTDVACRVLT